MKFKKKEKRINTTLWFTIFIVAIMVLSSIGFIANDTARTNTNQRYGEFRFQSTQDNRWVTSVNGKQMVFSYHPLELEYINATGAAKAMRDAQVIYVTFDPNATDLTYVDLARYEFATAMAPEKVIYNGIKEYAVGYPLPVLTCANATQGVAVISFEYASTPRIDVVGSCITAYGNTMDYLRVKDRLLYSYYGVME